jgi:hypothetical protein
VQGSLDMEQLDEAKVFHLLADHERSHEVFRAILDVDRKDQPDGSIRLTQNLRCARILPVRLHLRHGVGTQVLHLCHAVGIQLLPLCRPVGNWQ